MIIDFQANLVPHVAEPARVVDRARRLASYASLLGVPTTVTEQVPERMGGSLADITGALAPATPILSKVEFSCWRNATLAERLNALRREGRVEIIVAGVEAHVCVYQTVDDLVGAGFEVFVVADAVSSRETQARDIALDRMRVLGAAIVTQEMVAFEWLQRADHPAFRDALRIIK